LEQLQAVLKSEFLQAVREVYEHVYETVDICGNPEIAANATAKVTCFFMDCHIPVKLVCARYFHCGIPCIFVM